MFMHDLKSDNKNLAFLMPAERQKRILERLRLKGRVFATELAREFSASEDKIRRDLRDLAAQGLCQRVYGGALAISSASGSAIERSQQDLSRKHALGVALSALVKRDQFLFVDAGSTNLVTARSLPDGITVATHDPRIAATLIDRNGIDLITIGGWIHPHIGAAIGGQALRGVIDLRPDVLILGVCALDAEAGISVFNIEDAEMKRTLIQGAGSVVAAVLNEKLKVGAPHRVGAVDLIADLVVEADAPQQVVETFAVRGVRIHHAGPANKSK